VNGYVQLKALTDEAEGLELFSFYLERAREHAMQDLSLSKPMSEAKDLLTTVEVRAIFQKGLSRSKDRGTEGVSHPEFLNDLHEAAAPRLQAV
jgi:hypothetical protein